MGIERWAEREMGKVRDRLRGIRRYNGEERESDGQREMGREKWSKRERDRDV